jgi:hypothetical protein
MLVSTSALAAIAANGDFTLWCRIHGLVTG